MSLALAPRAGIVTADLHYIEPSVVRDFGDEATIRTVYYPEAETLLANIAGRTGS